MSAWVIGKTTRFAAAGVQSPLSKYISHFLTHDLCSSYAHRYFPTLPWQDPQGHWALSPLSPVANVTTPTLIIQGDQDSRTPLGEGLQLYHALKLRGVPAADGSLPVFAGDFPTLDLVEVTGTSTGRILHKAATPALFVTGICSASGAILSRKATEEMGPAKMATAIAGSGDYALTDWQPGQQITLEQNAAFAGPNKGSFQTNIIKPIVESRTALLALIAGELAMSEVAPQDSAQLDGAEGIVTVKTNRFDYTWIAMNVEKPARADLRVRQAIRLGLDIDGILAGACDGTVPRSHVKLRSQPASLPYLPNS